MIEATAGGTRPATVADDFSQGTEPYDAPVNVTQRKHSETSAGNSRSSAFAHRAVVLRGSSCVTLLSTPRFHSASSEPFLPKRKRARCGATARSFLVQLLKGTSLASIIGFVELTRAAQVVNNSTFRPFTVYAIVA